METVTILKSSIAESISCTFLQIGAASWHSEHHRSSAVRLTVAPPLSAFYTAATGFPAKLQKVAVTPLKVESL
ncbi:hypothetical protein H5410_053908 [Solanum commersonii]|uniref:Uncharacterized protein n=1 Tax=Solanum commersonii TaxID=4109 RepID=A0A9J5X4R3_SOLCO|nr:hypothetical protein H5410_053908 [Solanum commersonii]